MNSRNLVLGAAFLTALSACNHSAGSAADKSSTQDTVAPSLETEKANTDYKPVFPEQTRASGVKTNTPLSITVVNSGLDRPWAICNLPDGRFLVTEKGGTMQILAADGKTDKKISGLPAVVDKGQGGLLDVNIDPDFANNRIIYWDYAEERPEGSLLAIAKGRLSADETKIENQTVIYRAAPAYKGDLQFGSRIVFDQEGNLFISTGERSAKEIRVQAQDLSSALGKIIHITKDGKPVPGGPFANTPNARPEIYAYGLRNPDGLVWNPETGELWESEFGPRGGDEVNIIRAGKNYGWPVISYGIEYSGEKVGDGIWQKEGMEQPVYYWDPVIAPGGMTFYNSNAIPEWKGNLFVTGLRSTRISRLVIKDNKVIGEEWLLNDKGERFRGITVGKDGALYATTDGGKIYRVAKQ